MLRRADGSSAQLPIATGVDQCDPLSPFVFALGLPLPEIQRRIRGLLDGHPASQSERTFAALLSYLDDLSLVIQAELAAAARDIVIEELAKVKLRINNDKSAVFRPSCVPQRL